VRSTSRSWRCWTTHTPAGGLLALFPLIPNDYQLAVCALALQPGKYCTVHHFQSWQLQCTRAVCMHPVHYLTLLLVTRPAFLQVWPPHSHAGAHHSHQGQGHPDQWPRHARPGRPAAPD
jgi:hypothetical protein